MESTFRALWAQTPSGDTNDHAQIQCEIRETQLDELTSGDVVIQVEYSGINYKDALAVTGKGKILRALPLIPGIDMSGTVIQSRSTLWKEGDRVLLNGRQLGEKLTGGYSERVRLPGDLPVRIPHGLSSREAMIMGTAGFTAALAICQLEKNELRPAKGPVLVTGATGGVGSLAIAMLNQLGYETEAWTRRPEHQAWIESCGASKVTVTNEKDWTTRPLESVVWASAIDNVGGKILEHIVPRIDLWGSVASIGMASDHQLSTTVFPFILRGVNILGVSSNNGPEKLRHSLWERLASDLKPKNLDSICEKEITLDQLPQECQRVVKGQHRGRTLVKVS
ncbi:MAG: YhdH/YhfP family quinone oxidoreductase [Pseudomonadota bacterium]